MVSASEALSGSPAVPERRSRWGRERENQHKATANSASHASDKCEVADVTSVKQRERRWGSDAPPVSAPAKAQPTPKPGQRIVFTIGTWRVSREVYLWQLRQRGVKTLIDIRGNPKAGREEALHKGKDFTRALKSEGIHYEYWGDRLGEDQMDAERIENLKRLLKGLLAAIPSDPLCLLGHLHEPHKCHRLRICNLLLDACHITHLMWTDHLDLRSIDHVSAQHDHDDASDFFYMRKHDEETRRKSEITPGVDAATLSDLTKHAANLPVLRWQDLPLQEWLDRLRDGSPYRLLLPWETTLLWYPCFFSAAEADSLETTVHERLTMYHPTYHFQTPSGVMQETINRKGQAKVCDDFTFAVQYTSRKETMNTYNVDRFEPWSRAILRRVEAASETVFNAIWFNHYRDGRTTIHWHTDGDEGLGPNALIGSVSLGSTRDFCLKSKRTWPDSTGSSRIIHVAFPLSHGSLLVMAQNVQTHWLHAVPAMEGINTERTNLTFRFYAHKDLELAAGTASQQRDERHEAPSANAPDDMATAPGEGQTCQPFRIRLVPDSTSPSRFPFPMRPFLVDLPTDPATTVGGFCQRICDLLPEGVEHISLSHAKSEDGSLQFMDAKVPLKTELERLPRSSSVVELIFAIEGNSGETCVTKETATVGVSSIAWSGMLGSSSSIGCGELQRELQRSQPGAYKPPLGSIQADDGDWLWEIIQNLSGIQRKSKGRAQVSNFIFHQCSEFIAVYVSCPKSTVHLIIAPKRPLRRQDVSMPDGPMVRRMAVYSAFLASSMGPRFPGMRFASGLRVRTGSVQQFHAHLVSMDLSAPRTCDLEMRHFLDFTAGPSRFLALGDLVCKLAIGEGVPHGLELNPPMSYKGLSCHRCGHLFGDAMFELAKHLSQCEIWPSAHVPAVASASKQGSGYSEEDQICALEAMGFDGCGRAALRAALAAAGGSIEGAVAQLV